MLKSPATGARRGLMRIRRWRAILVAALGGLLLAGNVGEAFAQGVTPATGRRLVIGTATTTGVYSAAGNTLCRLLRNSPQGQGIACQSVYSKGSLQNVPDLAARRFDFAIIQSDVQHFAYLGQDALARLGPQKHLRHVL